MGAPYQTTHVPYATSAPAQTVAHSAVPSHPEPTALEWFKEINLLVIAALVPLGIAYLGYRSLKLKTERHNAIRRKAAEEIGEEPPTDETIMRVITSFKDKK